MRVPIRWLQEYIDCPADPRELGQRLTFSGTEVEGLVTLGGGLEQVVAAQVRAVSKHPKADRLHLCQVWDGTTEHRVVCGAPNVVVGGCYPLARLGVTLPGGLT
ncbi:MAG: phenylalanine--tRNA ligase subunit beta, partial [Candidatus Marinimicrobia bacterium]|nr:phenylalanine--tRNA ligase subunit beta [Candidatus Neomarinimicrobiota bacterium]